MRTFNKEVRDQIQRIASVINTDLAVIQHTSSDNNYLCADTVNKYVIGDRMVGGSTINIRQDINKNQTAYTITWWLHGEKLKGGITIYKDSTILITGALQWDYLFY